MRHSDEQVKEIILEFRKFGVKKCGATHSTSDKPITSFKKAYDILKQISL